MRGILRARKLRLSIFLGLYVLFSIFYVERSRAFFRTVLVIETPHPGIASVEKVLADIRREKRAGFPLSDKPDTVSFVPRFHAWKDGGRIRVESDGHRSVLPLREKTMQELYRRLENRYAETIREQSAKLVAEMERLQKRIQRRTQQKTALAEKNRILEETAVYFREQLKKFDRHIARMEDGAAPPSSGAWKDMLSMQRTWMEFRVKISRLEQKNDRILIDRYREQIDRLSRTMEQKAEKLKSLHNIRLEKPVTSVPRPHDFSRIVLVLAFGLLIVFFLTIV